MSAKIFWVDEQHSIVQVIYAEPWRARDIDEALEILTDKLDSVPHKVAIIVDVSRIKRIPRGILRALHRVVSTERPNEEMYYVVGANSVVRAIYNAAKTIYPAIGRLVTFTRTVEEAHDLIAERRKDVPDSSP